MTSIVTQPRSGIPIGHVVIGGRRVDVEINPEYLRFFADLLRRTGGTVANDLDALEDSLLNEVGQVPIHGMLGEIDTLRHMLSGLEQAPPASIAVAADPTASVALAASNGFASTFMRSDAAPALSQAISPTWTGNHVFAPASGNTTITAGNIGLGVASPLAKVHINANTSAATAFSGAVTHVSAGDGTGASFVLDGFANAPAYVCRRAQGSAGTKTAVQLNQNIALFDAHGYGATAYSSGARAGFRALAAEAWTDSAQGTYATISVTPTGSTTLAEQFRVDASYVEMKSQVRKTGVISPAQITSNQNDYNPTGLSTAYRLRINSDAARDITGLQGGADGREVFITNVGSFAITLKNSSASSTASNRFDVGADIVLGASVSVLLQYDGTSSRWRAA